MRLIEEKIFKFLMVLSTFIVFGGVILVLAVVLIKGIPVMSWDMLTQVPKGGFYMGGEEGGQGGILNAIVGTLIIGLGATFLATICAIPVVIFIHGYAHKRVWVSTIRFALDLLWGIPSIVYGILGFTVMMFFGIRASLLAGIITIAMLEFPIATRGIDEVIRLVPKALKETSFALGSTRAETIIKVILRQGAPGILTALLIAFGRGVGDAASVLLTAGFSDKLPSSVMDPVATLPLAIFMQLGSPYPEVQQRAYASALVLTAIILIISISTRYLMRKFAKQTVTG
jgi:phosphate transport system permease protein